MLNIASTNVMVEEKPQVAPMKYVVIQRIQHCACCSAKHEWSEVYSWDLLPARMSFGKVVTNLKSIFWPKYRLPIQQVRASKTDIIPFCHECYKPSLDHAYELLEAPPRETREFKVVMGGAGTTPTPVTTILTTKSKAEKPKASLSDLESLL